MLEVVWGLCGGPRCPLIAADSTAIAALLSGRACGPAQTLNGIREACQELLSFATSAAGDGARSPECKDAVA
eukprot:7297007-Lingulodinium_polyedra.AAC.1